MALPQARRRGLSEFLINKKFLNTFVSNIAWSILILRNIFTVYLKCKLNWVSPIWSGSPTKQPTSNCENYLQILSHPTAIPLINFHRCYLLNTSQKHSLLSVFIPTTVTTIQAFVMSSVDDHFQSVFVVYLFIF